LRAFSKDEAATSSWERKRERGEREEEKKKKGVAWLGLERLHLQKGKEKTRKKKDKKRGPAKPLFTSSFAVCGESRKRLREGEKKKDATPAFVQNLSASPVLHGRCVPLIKKEKRGRRPPLSPVAGDGEREGIGGKKKPLPSNPIPSRSRSYRGERGKKGGRKIGSIPPSNRFSRKGGGGGKKGKRVGVPHYSTNGEKRKKKEKRRKILHCFFLALSYAARRGEGGKKRWREGKERRTSFFQTWRF